MYALRERRQHVTQEDFEFAVAKVRVCEMAASSFDALNSGSIGLEEEPRGKYFRQQVVLVIGPLYHFGSLCISVSISFSSSLCSALPPAISKAGMFNNDIVRLEIAVDCFKLVPVRWSVDGHERMA